MTNMISFYLRILLLILLLNSFVACKKATTLFVKVNETQTHIYFENKLEDTPELNILNYLYYYNGAGVAAADFNNDGLVDLYFTGNQTQDKLYLNKENLKFEDITIEAGIENADNWTTGVTTVDINNDGLLDIYVCKVDGYRNLKGANLLYVNQGVVNGIPIFKEAAASYGVDFRGFSTQATFLDYDVDGDLDLFLLNHSVHPNRNYGLGSQRITIDSLSGDKFFENINSSYVDVSTQAGIFQGKIGYGLGVSVSDVNNDGYPDIYVGNDFFENDYLYINQQNKTFKEVISDDVTKLGHTSHFSMGNAISDINNDGNNDIISLDMLPEDIKTYKTSGLEYPFQTYLYYLKNGYAPQYMQNTLHLNVGNGNFSEVAFQSGIASTEWSWSPLIADFDNDGHKDMYITNGILGATNDMDFINFISNEKIQKKINQGMSKEDLSFIKQLPKKKVSNYFFKNKGNNTFENVTEKWFSKTPSYSNGSTFADLDNDGDLDVIVNNVNEKALILENTSNSSSSKNNYLKAKFIGNAENTFGIGAKIHVFKNKDIITYENNTTRGYLSAVTPTINIGLGITKNIDSLYVVWPGGKYQTLKNVKSNQQISLDYKNASGNYYKANRMKGTSMLSNTDTLFNYKHKDLATVEFNRDPLIPFVSTNLGPSLSVADVNNDTLEDVFISGGKAQASKLFIQSNDGSFDSTQTNIFERDAMNEDVDHVFFDANNDGFKDLIVVSGGNEFRKGKSLQPRLYFNKNGIFTKDTIQFKNIELNASKVKAVDIDNDGDFDISMTSNVVPWQFGITPPQYIFKNDGQGNFSDVTKEISLDFFNIGNVQDVQWVDLNNDTYKDAIVIGHWMPISIFINDGEKLTLQKNNSLKNTNGWWNAIETEDFDKDGDLDMIVSNWGFNTRLQASISQPITLYSNDFDDNGSIEPLITYFYQGVETPFASKDELTKQLPFLNKKYLSYSAFANADFEDLFPKEKVQNALKKKVFELGTCYFENLGNNTYKKHLLPFMAQITSVNDIAVDDFNNDGFVDVLLVGNNYEISTQLGRFDASHGVLLLNDTKGFFTEETKQQFDIKGPARAIEKIKIKGVSHYIVTINNDSPVFLITNNKE